MLLDTPLLLALAQTKYDPNDSIRTCIILIKKDGKRVLNVPIPCIECVHDWNANNPHICALYTIEMDIKVTVNSLHE